MANQDDNNNQEIEKVEDVEVETTKNTSDTDNKKQNNDDGYEKVCFICRRPESVAGKMIELPNHICVCNDCMQKSFDAMSNGPIDYSQLMNIPGVQVFNMADMEQSIPKQQKIKKKKEGEEYKDNFYSTLWNYNSFDGTTYGIPVGFTTHALFYNKDLFAEAGVEEPTDSWTWSDLQTAAKTIEEKTGQKGFAFQMKPDPYDFEMYLWSNEAAYCDEEGVMSGKIDSKESQEVFQMFQDMEKDGYAIATEKNGTDEFRAGTAAMYIYGSWSINSLDEDGMNYGIAKIPSFDGKTSVSILSSSGLSISKDSKNKEAAWEFVKYWTGEDCNKARIGIELPVLNSVVESEGIMDEAKYAPFYEMLEQSDGHTPASFLIEDWSEISENLSLSFEQIFNPSSYMDVKDVLKEAADAQ